MANQALHIRTGSVSTLHAHRRHHVQCEIVRIKLGLALSFPLVRNTTTMRRILIATCNEKYLLILHSLYLLLFKFRTTSLGRIFSGDFSFSECPCPSRFLRVILALQYNTNHPSLSMHKGGSWAALLKASRPECPL